MLEYLLPYAYLWPVATVVTLSLCILFFVWNLFLSAVILALYSLVPSYVIDSLLSSSLAIVRKKFFFYFEKIESNIRSTFDIVQSKPPPPRSVFIWHPHGLMSISSAIHNAMRITSKEYMPTKIVSMSIYHKLPIIKDFMRYFNVIPAEYNTIKETLKTDSVSIMLGGVREMMNTDAKTIQLIIKNRTGIFRAALESGSSLVPVITYGENELFPPIQSESIQSINSFLYSVFGIAIPIPTWTSMKNWVTLYSSPLKKITTHVGDTISVSQKEYPSSEDILDLKTRYIKAVESLFEKTNDGTYTLEIT